MNIFPCMCEKTCTCTYMYVYIHVCGLRIDATVHVIGGQKPACHQATVDLTGLRNHQCPCAVNNLKKSPNTFYLHKSYTRIYLPSFTSQLVLFLSGHSS